MNAIHIERDGTPFELHRRGHAVRRAGEAVRAGVAAPVGAGVACLVSPGEVDDSLAIPPPIVAESRHAHPCAS